jgi:hypothetical protein
MAQSKRAMQDLRRIPTIAALPVQRRYANAGARYNDRSLSAGARQGGSRSRAASGET